MIIMKQQLILPRLRLAAELVALLVLIFADQLIPKFYLEVVVGGQVRADRKGRIHRAPWRARWSARSIGQWCLATAYKVARRRHCRRNAHQLPQCVP